ncbi:MAG: family 20 glycosylhydrolase, partial [Candidatus Neomarinimicrobiota bacterium]
MSNIEKQKIQNYSQTKDKCTPNCDKEYYSSADKIRFNWELLNNDITVKNGFEAKFTIENKSEIKLTDTNWKLFFNNTPRLIINHKRLQPGFIQHISGDWFFMAPEKEFLLKPGDSIDITYQGMGSLIKESDAPSGLYFVFYDGNGNEKELVQVSDFTIVPFTKPEQINRNIEDEEPIQKPEFQYSNNLDMVELDSSEHKLIIPSPISIKSSKGNLTVNNKMNIHYQKELESEAKFLATKLESLTGNIFIVTDKPIKDKAISLNFGNVKTKEGLAEEAYSLNVSPNGITITGNESAGVYYGIQSLLALVPLDAYKKNVKSIKINSVLIIDAPRFAFRSIHVDVCRNFQNKETIKRILDILAFYKVNRFLFHITDDEGWRLEINGLPELTSTGGQREHAFSVETPVLHPAYGSGPNAYEKGKYGSGFYTRDDFIELLTYAKERHIKITPEINLPGHARAAIKAMEARYIRLINEG